MYIQERRGPGHSCPNWGGIPGSGGTFFHLSVLFMNEMARSSGSCDGPKLAASNTAIESFWRCIVVELWLFLWSIRGP